MKRREFIALVGAAIVWPLTGIAQDSDHRAPPVVGFLDLNSERTMLPLVEVFQTALRALGYIDGRNIRVLSRFADWERRAPFRTNGRLGCSRCQDHCNEQHHYNQCRSHHSTDDANRILGQRGPRFDGMGPKLGPAGWRDYRNIPPRRESQRVRSS